MNFKLYFKSLITCYIFRIIDDLTAEPFMCKSEDRERHSLKLEATGQAVVPDRWAVRTCWILMEAIGPYNLYRSHQMENHCINLFHPNPQNKS